MIELPTQDSTAFQDIVSVLHSHPELKKWTMIDEPILSFPGLDIYPRRRKVFHNHQEIQLTHKEYEILLLLVTNKGWVLTYSQIYEKHGTISPQEMNVILLDSISVTCEKNSIKRLLTPLLPSDLSGKLDTVLKYKQRNKVSSLIHQAAVLSLNFQIEKFLRYPNYKRNNQLIQYK